MTDDSIVNYLREGTREGHSIKSMKNELLKEGWKKTEVDEAVKIFQNQMQQQEKNGILAKLKSPSDEFKLFLILFGLWIIIYVLILRFNCIVSIGGSYNICIPVLNELLGSIHFVLNIGTLVTSVLFILIYSLIGNSNSFLNSITRIILIAVNIVYLYLISRLAVFIRNKIMGREPVPVTEAMTIKKSDKIIYGFVVFAFLFLIISSLALELHVISDGGMWINDLSIHAQNRIQNVFSQTNETFAIYPSRYRLEKGQSLKMAAGIKNDAADDNNHTFVINIIPSTATQTICPEQDIEICTAPDGSVLKKYMSTWTVFPTGKSDIQANNISYRYITITVPGNAVSGIYQFDVLACCTDCEGSDVEAYSDCIYSTRNWGSIQSLEITVK